MTHDELNALYQTLPIHVCRRAKSRLWDAKRTASFLSCYVSGKEAEALTQWLREQNCYAGPDGFARTLEFQRLMVEDDDGCTITPEFLRNVADGVYTDETIALHVRSVAAKQLR